MKIKRAVRDREGRRAASGLTGRIGREEEERRPGGPPALPEQSPRLSGRGRALPSRSQGPVLTDAARTQRPPEGEQAPGAQPRVAEPPPPAPFIPSFPSQAPRRPPAPRSPSWNLGLGSCLGAIEERLPRRPPPPPAASPPPPPHHARPAPAPAAARMRLAAAPQSTLGVVVRSLRSRIPPHSPPIMPPFFLRAPGLRGSVRAAAGGLGSGAATRKK